MSTVTCTPQQQQALVSLQSARDAAQAHAQEALNAQGKAGSALAKAESVWETQHFAGSRHNLPEREIYDAAVARYAAAARALDAVDAQLVQARREMDACVAPPTTPVATPRPPAPATSGVRPGRRSE